MSKFNIPNSKYIDKFSLNATAKAPPVITPEIELMMSN